MDYRYETPDEARKFHKQRRAFIVINNKLEFLPKGSPMSHYEYCLSKNISKQVFNSLIRGYYLDGNLVFYKDSFVYDKELILESLNYLTQIAKTIEVEEFNVYFGIKINNGFHFDLYYGKYKNGEIIKE